VLVRLVIGEYRNPSTTDVRKGVDGARP